MLIVDNMSLTLKSLQAKYIRAQKMYKKLDDIYWKAKKAQNTLIDTQRLSNWDMSTWTQDVKNSYAIAQAALKKKDTFAKKILDPLYYKLNKIQNKNDYLGIPSSLATKFMSNVTKETNSDIKQTKYGFYIEGVDEGLDFKYKIVKQKDKTVKIYSWTAEDDSNKFVEMSKTDVESAIDT